MNLLRWITGFTIALGVAAFAVLNRQEAALYWSPLHPPLELPLYITGLGFLSAGFLIGAFTVWFNSGRIRRQTRLQRKTIRHLEKELEGANQNRPVKDEPPADFFPALIKNKSNP